MDRKLTTQEIVAKYDLVNQAEIKYARQITEIDYLEFYFYLCDFYILDEVKTLFRSKEIKNEKGQNALHLFTLKLGCGKTVTLNIAKFLIE